MHFRGHSDLCAYRNLYSWEILSTKRLDCLRGLIGTRLPFGGDDDKGISINAICAATSVIRI